MRDERRSLKVSIQGQAKDSQYIQIVLPSGGKISLNRFETGFIPE